MSLCHRHRAAILQRSQSVSQSDNSHSSESTTSQPSNASSNTSCSTHFPPPPILGSLPNGAAPPSLPQLSSSALQKDWKVTTSLPAPKLSPPARTQKPRVLRKSLPAINHSGKGLSRGDAKKWTPFSTPARDVSSRSLSRARINLDDEDASVATVTNEPTHNRYISLPGSSRSPPSSYGNARRSRSVTRPRPRSPISSGSRVSEQRSLSLEMIGRLRAEIARVGEDPISSARGQRQDHLNAINPLRLDQPLPNPPGPSRPPYEGPNTPQFRLPTPSRHSSYVTVSAEEEAESQFGHFSSSPDSRSQGQDEFTYTPRVSWPDVGRANDNWEGKGTSGSDSQRDSVYHRHHTENYIPSYVSVASSPLTRHPSDSVSPTAFPEHLAVPSPSFCAYGAPYVTQHASVTSKLSLGKRIKRTLSFSLFKASKEVGHGVHEFSYPYSQNGHAIALHKGLSASPTTKSWSQDLGDLPQNVQVPRRLKKRPPSFLLDTMPASTFGMARSSSDIGHSQSHATTNPEWNPMKRAKSSPPRHRRVETRPPVELLTNMTSPITATESYVQPTSPSPRKLTKKGLSQKWLESTSDSLDVTLPPVRTVSPLDFGLKGSTFSQASRSRSAPNLWPPPLAPPRGSNADFDHDGEPPLQFLSVLTDSPPSSPLSERLVRPEYIENGVSPISDRPSDLRLQPDRRWTLAASEVPDEQLVAELERLRSVGWGLGFQGELIRFKGKGKTVGEAKDGEDVRNNMWEKSEDDGWLVARRALMVCREIVRTERSYREGMVRLQRGETQKAPPPLLLQYLPALIEASQALSSRLDDDPSAWGVSAAFIGMEDILEAALVAWSGIVGDFFSANKGKERRRWSAGPSDKSKKEKKTVTGAPILPPVGSRNGRDGQEQYTYVATKSAPSTWRMSMPILPQLLTTANDPHHNQSQKHRQSMTPQSSPTSVKTPTVQDLAIQPTQRVMRYVLLYKDLLNSTPIVSPARPLVERALEGATRIAQRCNRAQDNAAFLT